MHLADAFIQSDLLIQAIHLIIISPDLFRFAELALQKSTHQPYYDI